MLQDRLESIARMMEGSPHYSEEEVRAWRLLMAHVDEAHFNRTGQIVACELAPDVWDDESERSALSVETFGRAVEDLVKKGHLSVVNRKDAPHRYQLFLHQDTSINL